MLNCLISFDVKLFYAINHFHSFFLTRILPIFSEPKFLYLFYGITSSILWIRYSFKKVLIIYVFLILGFLWVDFSCARLLKPYFHRKRPFVSIKSVYYPYKKAFKLLKKPLIKHTSYSFPSNHACNVGYASSFLSLYFPKGAVLWIIVALLVGWSRIYLGVHFPFDVFAGYIYGFFWALIFYKLSKVLLNKFK